MMKKIFTLATILMIFSQVNAQPWFDVGIKAGVGTSFMYDKQIFDDQDLTHKFMPGYTFGGKFGFNFVQAHQVTLDVLKTSYTQKFVYYVEGKELGRKIGMEGIDFALMYRYNNRGTYFEVGPQYTITSKVTFSDEGDVTLGIYKPEEVIDKNYYAIAAGFGGYIFGTDNFGVTMGIRANYTITDIASDNGRSINFPMLVDKEADPLRNLGIMFVFEANYDFGYLVSPSCGKRGKLFVF
ncbi:MAG TPA: hypothetical protein VK212_03330 [Lentimicrobium sp.]|nr:hypothetical protein [Lentimicrobium sp.]